MKKTPKSESESAVKPQVIDLDAEEVVPAAEPVEEEIPPPPPPPPAKRKTTKTWSWLLAALLVGALAGGWLYRDLLSAYLPTDEMTSMKAALATLEAREKTAAEQLTAVASSADQASQAASAAQTSAKETSSALSSLKSELGKSSSRLEQTEKALAAARSDLDSLRTAVASGMSSGTGTGDTAALAAIGQRLDALEKDVESLKSAKAPEGQAQSLAALTQALSDINAKIAAGTPYRVEFDRIARMVPAAAGLDVLEAQANQGLPTAAGLAEELRAAIPTLPKPSGSAAPESTGYWQSFWNAVGSVVKIRNVGETDWQALAGECAGLAEAGDLTSAIARIDEAEGSVPAALAQWRDRAAARLKLEAALAQVSEAVERQIASVGGAQ